MSSSDEKKTDIAVDEDRRNDPYGWVDGFADDLHAAAKELVEKGEASRISDEALAKILTASVRLYYAKAEGEGRTPPAVMQEGDQTLSPTEMLTTVSEMLRAVRLGPMELGLWFRRQPGD
jgi:urease gamma subunit